jgi:transposase-like protein
VLYGTLVGIMRQKRRPLGHWVVVFDGVADLPRASAQPLQALQDRDLSTIDVVAVFLDGKTFADLMMVVAVGITLTGEKHILGFVETGTENEAVLTPFL